MSKKYFGTDGIRGRTGEFPITPAFMLRLGWAAGKVFSDAGIGKILIGKDTRISGYMFESALEAGLVSAGVDVLLLGPMPTPAIAYLTRTFSAQAGIVISASHNPYYDNGIKFFSDKGEKLSDEIEFAIEACLDQADSYMEIVESNQIGKVSRINDAAGRYIEFCKRCYPAEKNLHGHRILLDCAHGAAYHIAPNVFRELGAEVIETGVSPNGFNINEKVGSTEPEILRQKVIEAQADYGIAFDGDGDRLIMADDQGDIVDGDGLLYIIASHRAKQGSLKGGVVGTLMSNFGLEKALAAADIAFCRVQVGDRYVLSELRNRGWVLGGESSGHILCLDQTSTGCGIVSALQVVAAISATGKSLKQLRNQMLKYPQKMINVPCGGEVIQLPEITQAIKQAENTLNGAGRVLVRASGTESVVRVMVEGEELALVTHLAQQLAASVMAAAGQ